MAAAQSSLTTHRPSIVRNRWFQMIVGITGMVMIANLQYGWTLFVQPIHGRFHWGRAAIQVAFTTFVLFETWLVPFEAYLVDRFGPQLCVATGRVLVAVPGELNSVADSLAILYAAAAIGGIGAGVVHGTAVGSTLKWFPDHRGLAAGLTAAGFGAGSALTAVPISKLFVIGSGLTFFGWGEIYSLFPVTSGDLFGRAYATTNYGLLRTAKGTAALLVSLGNVLHDVTGSWLPVCGVAIVLDAVAAVLAITALRWLIRAHAAHSVVPEPGRLSETTALWAS